LEIARERSAGTPGAGLIHVVAGRAAAETRHGRTMLVVVVLLLFTAMTMAVARYLA
jgi:hypothetical protein